MNKNFKFKIKSKAYNDMEVIADYIAEDNKIAARNLIEKFYQTFQLLCEQPDIGRVLEGFYDKTVRFFVVKKHYLVIYKKANDSIQILRVLSGYQDICRLL